ncbi:Modification methylase HaeIII [subsurface metagenome]
MIVVLSLFPGIGLLDRGFEAEGFCVVRGPDLLWGGDVRLFHAPPGKFDGVIGGPPCQDFSALANVNPNRKKSTYGLEMLAEMKRVILEADPEWFLTENVPRVPHIEVEGYHVQRFNLDAHWFGGDQRRKRSFQFGSRKPVNIVFKVPLFESPVFAPPVMATEVKQGSRAAHRNLAYIPSRPWPELCRLQGLPEDFQLPPFKKVEAGRAVGEGVPVHVAQAWAKAIKAAIYYTEG